MNNLNPLVTVYITNYNYSDYIKTSIESVLAQTLQDFELLIIDDGSTDNSKEIIEDYRDIEGITIIYQQNKGLNITNNVAMRAASGKYLMRLDADDFLETDALAEMSRILDQDNELGLIFPDYYYVDIDGVRTGEERRHNFEKEVSLYDQPAHGACTMIRLEFLKKLGGYNESFTCQDGYDLWIKFITHYKVTNINKPLFSYRRHGNNLTTNEGRILETRRAIKHAFVNQHYGSETTLVIIPVRNYLFNGKPWPLEDFNGMTVLEKKIQTCLEAETVSAVVVTSSNKQIMGYCDGIRGSFENVLFLERPKNFAEVNQSLNDTVQLSIEHAITNGVKFSSIMTVSLEYPFIESSVIDDLVHTHLLFKSDSVLSVRPDNRTYYQHTGHTLKPILDQDKFSKLEREALYKATGGLVLSSLNNFNKNRKLACGKISHVVVDEKSAFGVHSIFDYQVFKSITNEFSFIND